MNKELQNTFTNIYEKNLWGSVESVSGTGSELKATQKVRNELVHFVNQFNVNSILDAPCGDCNWISKIFDTFEQLGITYVGADIVPAVIESNRNKYKNEFDIMDITTQRPRKFDLILTRDCFGHLTNKQVLQTLKLFKESGSRWLMTTTFTKGTKNGDTVPAGGWRPIYLMIPPFNLIPEYLANERCQEGYPDKCLMVIDLQKINFV